MAYKLVKEFQRQWTCLVREEVDDLLQECLSHWVFVKAQYDPKREASLKTFMGRIIRNKLTDLVRERESDKRKLAHLSVSLDAPLTGDVDAPTLMDTLDARAGADPPHQELNGLQLKIDIATALKTLTARQQTLCHLLGEQGMTIQDASAALGISRSTLYDELKFIKALFIKFGLDGYLK
ncbi:MAG: sigma-70 family RNA polymerase sigma factor [Gammaproteobacteria bacterium]